SPSRASCACDGVKLQKATIAPIQIMPRLIVSLRIAVAVADIRFLDDQMAPPCDIASGIAREMTGSKVRRGAGSRSYSREQQNSRMGRFLLGACTGRFDGLSPLLGRLLDRYVRWLGAVKNAVDCSTGPAEMRGEISPKGDKRTGLHHLLRVAHH